MSPFRHRPVPITPARRWQPLTDAEWGALLPYVLVREGPGRPLRDARRRMDAIRWTAAASCPWREVPPRFGKADAVGRHFRRLCHAGLRERLLRALARPDRPPALLAVERWVVSACRRAARLRGLGLLVPARRLGLLSALRAPRLFLPEPDSSEIVDRWLARRRARPRARAAGPRGRRLPALLPPPRAVRRRSRAPRAAVPARMTPAARGSIRVRCRRPRAAGGAAFRARKSFNRAGGRVIVRI